MKDYCKRGGYCDWRMIGNAPTASGLTFRLCVRGGELKITDRVALGMPAQPRVIIRRPRTVEELEEVSA